MEEWLSLLSVILSIITIVIAIILSLLQNKKTNERLEKTLNLEINLRNKRVQKMFDVIKDLFNMLEFDSKKRMIMAVMGSRGVRSVYSDPKIYKTKDDIHIPIKGDYKDKKALLTFFKDDFKYIWIDKVSPNFSFYDGSIYESGNNLIICKGFYETTENVEETKMDAIISFILNKIKKDCKKYYGIKLK